MATDGRSTTSAGELARKSRIEEYERLKERDQQAFMAAETPAKFLASIKALARTKR